jgi:hypothetical protein
MSGRRQHDEYHVIPLRFARRQTSLVTCSVCLRVHDAGGWIDAEEAIRRFRTFEHEHVVRLGGALCDRCELELRLRRQSVVEPLAA